MGNFMDATLNTLMNVNFGKGYFGKDFTLTTNEKEKATTAQVINYIATVIKSLHPWDEINVSRFELLKRNITQFTAGEKKSATTQEIIDYIDNHLCPERLKVVNRILSAEKPTENEIAYLVTIVNLIKGVFSIFSLLKEIEKQLEIYNKLQKEYPNITITVDNEDIPAFQFSVRQNDQCTAEAIGAILKFVKYPRASSLDAAAKDDSYLSYLLLNQKHQDPCVAENATNALGQLLLNESTVLVRKAIAELKGNLKNVGSSFFAFHANQLSKINFKFKTITKNMAEAAPILAAFEAPKNQKFFTNVLTKIEQTIEQQREISTLVLPNKIAELQKESDLSAKCTKFNLTQPELKAILEALNKPSLQKKSSPPRDIPGKTSQKVEPNQIDLSGLTPPFICDGRVLDYMDRDNGKDPLQHSPQSQLLLNKYTKEELYFDHDFAWIINWLVLPYGIPSQRYNENNKKYETQYTLGLEVCKEGQLPYYTSATFTFSAETQFLYHRSLTKASQGLPVDQMLSQAYFKGNYPPLINEDIDIDNTLRYRQKVDDGSFIEKVEGTLIFVRDPKNKALIKVFS
jgi:hypothetical protein